MIHIPFGAVDTAYPPLVSHSDAPPDVPQACPHLIQYISKYQEIKYA